MSALTHPDDLSLFHLITLRSALRLEVKGMRSSRGSAYATVKRLGFRGTKPEVLAAFSAHVDALKAARDGAIGGAE